MATTGQRMRTAQVLIGLVCVAMLAQVGRLVYIQTRMRPKLLEWSEKCQRSEVTLPGRRGQIMDRRHRVLAGSHDLPTIFADPTLLQVAEGPLKIDHAEAARLLSQALSMTAEQILRKLQKPTSRRFVILREEASRQEIDDLLLLKERDSRLRGVDYYMQPVRDYPGKRLGVHVLGFVGADGKGLEGIELAYDRYLAAKPGKRVIYRDVSQNPLFQTECTPPQDGMNVILTLDAYVQQVAERYLSAAVDKYKAECGLAVVTNPKNGEVLALSVYPNYDPTAPAAVRPEARRNRIVTDPMEPGSIFKPYVMVTALADRLCSPQESIYCHNGLYVCGSRLLHDHHPYGSLTVEQIMAKSSNIGMAILGQRLGNRRMQQALSAMGFGRKTGIDLPGESEGLLMPLRDWTSYSTTSVPMGHELAVTPIQVATAYGAIMNGGYLFQPRVVAGVVDPQGKVIEDHTTPINKGLVIDPDATATMREILCKVINEGTGRTCSMDNWQVMGKTGTAQVPSKNHRGYEPNAYLSSFCASATAADPSVVVLVMIRKPSRSIGYYGSQVSGPVVREIMNEILPYLEIPPDKLPGSNQERPQIAPDDRD